MLVMVSTLQQDLPVVVALEAVDKVLLMRPQFIVDAFENGPFTGNPAAVVPLERWIPDDLMQAIAGQNNISETAFFVPEEDAYGLRWFTPTDEVPLCGHATLATAHVIFEEVGSPLTELEFNSASGPLSVSRDGDRLALNFPSTMPELEFDGGDPRPALGIDGELLGAYGNAFVVAESEAAVHDCSPDMEALIQTGTNMVVVSAPAEEPGSVEFDIVTRVFAPQVGIPEDPATGSAHCLLTPYWCEKLGVEEIRSLQASERGGYFVCRDLPEIERVEISGTCRTFGRGEIDA
jgi:PhzF family phenazine biosynthesis protein